MDKTLLVPTPSQLARVGNGVLGYVRQIEAKEARAMLGEGMIVPPNATLFCLYNADGTPVSISGSREAALGSAHEHELVAASVH
jgi:hypothetical protein